MSSHFIATRLMNPEMSQLGTGTGDEWAFDTRSIHLTAANLRMPLTMWASQSRREIASRGASRSRRLDRVDAFDPGSARANSATLFSGRVISLHCASTSRYTIRELRLPARPRFASGPALAVPFASWLDPSSFGAGPYFFPNFFAHSLETTSLRSAGET